MHHLPLQDAGDGLKESTYEVFTRRAKHLGHLSAMPVILTTLLEGLSVSSSKVDVDKIVQTISYDKSLVAQSLRMANSALYRQRGDVVTIRDAVMTLGLSRIRDLAFSCNLPLMFSGLDCIVPKESFWRHSLATGFLTQKLAADFGDTAYPQAYLAGLLHDIGILMNALLFANEFREILREAVQEQVCLHAIEQRVLGFTHAESGRFVAELWKLPTDVAEVAGFHHQPEAQETKNELTLLVITANRLCWYAGLGYDYTIQEQFRWAPAEAWLALMQKFPKASSVRVEEFGLLLETYLTEAQELVDRVFKLPLKAE
jgi:HD-like signal output (HDOD) protein